MIKTPLKGVFFALVEENAEKVGKRTSQTGAFVVYYKRFYAHFAFFRSQRRNIWIF
jgi:hypothetical protein